jgi:DNA repair protein RadC
VEAFLVLTMEPMVTSLKHWAESDRPRERLLARGPQVLSDAELIAILLGSGSRDESAVDLARRILRSAGNELSSLGKLTSADLGQYKGMGQAKSATLLAALELGRRRRQSEAAQRGAVTSSRDAFEYFVSQMGDLTHEEFWIMLLNRANHVVALRRVSEGGLHATVVDLKKVFGMAFESKASAIIAAHNHPSGQLKPSDDDKRLTRRLFQCGKLLDCPLLDHLIVTAHGYYSFSDEHALEE